MFFGQGREPFSYDLVKEGDENILRFDCEQYSNVPSIEDDPICMSRVIDKLIEVTGVTKIVFVQKRDYEYDYNQTKVMIEIARLYNKLTKQKESFGYLAMSFGGIYTRDLDQRYKEIQRIIFHLLKSDPLGAYVELKRAIRRERIRLQNTIDPTDVSCTQKYIDLLNSVVSELDRTRLITIARPYLPGYKLGIRDIYRRIFTPIIKPDFMFTKLMSTYPADGEEMESYLIGGTKITMFKFPDSTQYLYHMIPPEFVLSEEKYEILDLARKIMAEHKPTKEEFVDPERMRQVFYNVGIDLIEELANHKKLTLSEHEVKELGRILVRYTVGFGLIEVLLQDEKIQDISINSPMGHIPMFIVHGDYFECRTNIIPTTAEADSWASKLRMISGRPLDEANPILDTDLQLPGANTRVAAIAPPLSPTGLAYSFRRHRDRPWTLPLFMKAGMLSPLAAGLLNFLIDGTRTILICGTRSSGKTSLLGSLLVEIMKRYRIITIEDTLELPTVALRKLGFNIQSLKVAGALTVGSSEVDASTGIRSTLRLGDSALIVGEVRSKEAVALYEAMRIGAAANVVAGTIHSDSPFGVYDRVVNDIGIPKTSFKATDICVIANPIKSADGLHKLRRVTQITEIGKKWKDDPSLENGFKDLLKYDAKKDVLEPTNDLITGESEVLKNVAGNIKEFAGNWDAVWDNILMRARCKESLLNVAEQLKDFELLEAPFVIRCNDQMHLISDQIKAETGIDTKEIFRIWELWLKREAKKKSI